MTAALTTVIALVAGGWFGTPGSGQIREETRPVSEFTALEIGAGLQAEVTLGSASSLSIRGDDNLLPLIHTTVERGTLRVQLDRTSGGIRPTKPIRLTITTPSLRDVGASGGAQVTIRGSLTGHVQLEASGGAHLFASTISADALDLAMSGGATAELAGSSRKASLELSGGAVLDARQLTSETVDLEASGGSEASFGAEKTLSADLSGGSSAEVIGHPDHRSVHTSGGASLSYHST